MYKQNTKSFIVVIFCCFFLSLSPFLTKRWNKTGTSAVICWDTYGYYLYLPSFFYDNLGKLNNYDYIHNTYHPGSDTKDEAFIQTNTGKYVMNYSCGQAIIELPAFAFGHVWAKLAGYKADGFTLPYQVAITFWCVIIGCLGLWFMRKLLLRYFDDWIVAVVLLVICTATNFYNFVSFSVMTHAFLFTIYALILLSTDTFYRTDKRRVALALFIGYLSGLATIIRPTEIICALIPMLWGVSNLESLKARIGFFLTNLQFLVLYIFAAVVAALPQLIYWKVYAGHWLFFSYHGDDKTFSFLHPHIINILFSYQKGWFTYTPVMVLSILGFYQLYNSYRSLFWCIISFTIVNIYLVSAWDIWWYGGSFSMRALIQSYPLLMFPMATFFNDVIRRKYWQYLLYGFLLFCIWLNLLMIYQANGSFKYGIMEGEGTTSAYYWRIFGKTEINLKDKKLLDTNEEMPDRLEAGLKQIYSLDFDSIQTFESTITYNGKRGLKLDEQKQLSDTFKVPLGNQINKGWYRIYAKIFFPDKERNIWDQTQFKVVFFKGNKTIKEKMIRIQRVTEQGIWNEVFLDIKVPNKEYNTFEVYFWNANSRKTIYINNIKVYYTTQN